MAVRLGYPVEEQHYFSGFVLLPEQRAAWAEIAEAAGAAQRAGVGAFIWALPQVARDGFVAFDERGGAGEDDVQAFDAVDFPLAIGTEAVVATEFSPQILHSDRKRAVKRRSV